MNRNATRATSTTSPISTPIRLIPAAAVRSPVSAGRLTFTWPIVHLHPAGCLPPRHPALYGATRTPTLRQRKTRAGRRSSARHVGALDGAAPIHVLSRHIVIVRRRAPCPRETGAAG